MVLHYIPTSGCSKIAGSDPVQHPFAQGSKSHARNQHVQKWLHDRINIKAKRFRKTL